MLDKNLLKELKPYKQQIYAAIILDIAAAGVIIARCYCIADIINKMLFFQLGLKTAVPQLVLLFLLFLAEAVMNMGVKFIFHRISADIRKAVRCAIIKKLISSSPLSSIYNADILQTMTKGVDSFDAYFSKLLPQLVITVIIPVMLLPVAFYNDWVSGLVFLFTLPLIPFFMMLIGKTAQAENNRQWSALTHLSTLFMELLSGMSVIKIYNQTKNQLEKAINTGEQFSRTVLRVLRIAFLSAFFLELIATLSIAVIAVNMGIRLLYGQMDFLPAFFILLLAPEFYKPLRQTGSMFHESMGALTNSAKIYKLLYGDKTDDEYKNGKAKGVWQAAPQIVFDGVDFHYSDKREGVLCHTDINFAAGKATALVGRSGAGKSTILSLLLKFAKPDRGHILIDGIDLASLDENEWRSSIAYIPQQAHIFNTTVRENICMGRQVSAERLRAAIEKSGLAETIEDMPQKMDTVIGSGGRSISTGQARRISMARIFLSDARILLLDEPMEGLDAATESIVQKGINELSVNKTVIIIAHRLSSIQNADEIYVLSEGNIAEHGNDYVLRKQKGLYAKMISGIGGS